MKLPKEIKGVNKIRDASILQDVLDWYDSDAPKTERVNEAYRRISEKHELSQRRIEQIVTSNMAFLTDPERENAKQILRIKREIAKSSESKKDKHDWEKLLSDKITVQRSKQEVTKTDRLVIVRYDGTRTENRAERETRQVRFQP